MKLLFSRWSLNVRGPFYPAAEYLDTERITKIEADHFKSRQGGS